VWDYAGVNSQRAGRLDELSMQPTVKPVALIVDAIKDVTAPKDFVLDPFCGSGSILIAAERTDRQARALEIDPRFVDVAVRRWQKYAGKNAIHAVTGETFEQHEERELSVTIPA
jgi:DNA modification methylase